MAFPVYSERLLATAIPNGYTEWGVPPGHRAVIRCVTCTAGANSQQYSEITAAGMYLFYFDLPGPNSVVEGDLRVVLYEYELIRVIHTGPVLWTTVHGYLFEDPGGRRSPPPANLEGRPAEPESIEYPVPPGHRA